METPPEYHKSFRGRANTLERTEQIRPPRRKRRSQDSDGRRAGSVPPQPSTSFSGRSRDHETTPTTIVVNPGSGSSTSNHLLPVHFPRVRRASRQKQSYGSAGSAPSSGTNTPDTIHGSSAVDLYDLTPFGSLESSGNGSGVGVGKSNTLRAARHKNRTSAPGSTKWNWIWNRTSSSGGSGKNSPDNLKPDIKHGSSFLGRKRKSRHISCPDISSASDSASDMSRSTSPVGFKVSLSSLFGGHRGHGGHHGVVDVAAGAAAAASTSTSRSHGSSSSTARRSLGLSKAEKSSSQKAHLTYAKPVMSQVDDFTSEIIDELCSVQYCHISDPLRGLSVETLNPQEIEARYSKIKLFH